MHAEKIIELINASQASIKSELLPNTSTHQYQLQMLIKSFEILKQYITHGSTLAMSEKKALERYFQFPIDNIDDARAQLCMDIREGSPIENIHVLLKSLNENELNITESKRASHG
ncbi:hypothetical protein SAMN05421749_1013 [Acinetobacter marinus]|uniref:Uncharacterized protein n=1 Tax=Acinetobacter marinus TaxID=281375 RepID=A0A1G6GHY7_9GAMM|nr:hypothetical protein [Acinetobacter marinus]SDB81621.1 hypothetical protein SAMN05421749_1013 [Acinetobacter marinus]